VHVAKAPQEHLDEMKEIIRRLEKKTKQTGMTATNDERLRPFDDPATVKLFLEAPGRMLADARKAGPCRRAARLVQTALAMELLLMTLMRISNLTSLDLDQHIRRSSGGKRAFVRIPQKIVKNEVRLDFPLPNETVALLDIYLRDYRRHLVTMPTTALFPGRTMGFLSPIGFGTQISKTVKAYTGLTVNPHLFRHIGAKLYLEKNPGAYEVVRRLLGHRSIDVTTKFYTGPETASAIRHYQASILGQRHGGGRP
jgi:integrase